MTTYAELDELLGKRDSRKVGNNTYVKRMVDGIAVRLHATDILFFHPNETVTMDVDGWHTPTTLNRLNQYLPAGVRVSSNRSVWYLSLPGGTVPYVDGAVISCLNGQMIEGLDEVEDRLTELEEDEEVRKAIDRYIRGYKDEVVARLQEDTGRGDCMFCQFVVTNGPHKGKAMGDMGDNDHLLIHLEKKYYMRSLVINALREDNVGIIFKMDPFGSGAWPEIHRKAMRKYLKKRLLKGAVMKSGWSMV